MKTLAQTEKTPSTSYRKPGLFFYSVLRFLSVFIRLFLYKTKILRNEIRHLKGAFVVIANHQSAADFVNLIGLSPRRMTFVISDAFYNTLPCRCLMERMNFIHKQQFQTIPHDLKKMRDVIQSGEPLVIFPAGLMCEDGLSTPIPKGTYRFLKWLGADVYTAKTEGAYFVMPKWTKKLHPGRTFLSVSKLFGADELRTATEEQIREKTNRALLFDAYREQKKRRIRYKNVSDISGLENVLYRCPKCRREFTLRCEETSKLVCSECDFAASADEFGILHDLSQPKKDLFPSDWSREIQKTVERELSQRPESELKTHAKVHLIDKETHKFTEVGKTDVTLSRNGFTLKGILRNQPFEKQVRIDDVPMLPFKPGKYIEIQDGSCSYRLILDDGRLAQKFIHYVKAFYRIQQRLSASTAS